MTGSNAVNVFLGIGIAWTIAAFVNMYRGTEDGGLGYFHVSFVASFLLEAISIIVVRLGSAHDYCPSRWPFVSHIESNELQGTFRLLKMCEEMEETIASLT